MHLLVVAVPVEPDFASPVFQSPWALVLWTRLGQIVTSHALAEGSLETWICFAVSFA